MSSFEFFITCKDDKLYDGNKEFRFVSFNIPNLHINEDPHWHFTTEWEQRDALKSIKEMNGKVVRIYTFSIAKKSDNLRTHIIAPNEYDEEVFRYLDKAIEIANEYGIRLIIPFIDQWSWWGGVKEFASFYNLEGNCFWHDKDIREGFKSFITYLLNRKNYYTGVKYCDEKAIMAWETGNEIYLASDEWTRDITAHIKSIDKNHLVIDGRNGVFDNCLENPYVDIIASHYYNYSCDTPFVKLLEEDLKKVNKRKPFILAEYGITYLEDIKAVTELAVDSNCCGALIWSLRFHSENGGFYFHEDGNKPVTSRSYHYPAFKDNDDYFERDIINLITENAYRIDGLPVKPKDVPEPPLLFQAQTPLSISWRGSTGAEGYDIYRRYNEKEWVLVYENCSDCKQDFALFSDIYATLKGEYEYYLVAKNSSGSSDKSNIIKITV